MALGRSIIAALMDSPVALGTPERISPKFAGMVTEMELLRGTIAEGVPLGIRFTVRQAEVIPPPRAYGPNVVQRMPRLLRVSQGMFASYLGVNLGIVTAWEEMVGVLQPVPLEGSWN